MRATLCTALLCCLSATSCLAQQLDAAGGGVVREYVALGDSYASGVGVGDGDYRAESSICYRSDSAWPAIVARGLQARQREPLTFKFEACGGAEVPTVRWTQLSALSPATDLVTLQIGGNDGGFITVVLGCLLGDERACGKVIDDARGSVPEIKADILELVGQIRQRAPNARLVLTNYPDPISGPYQKCRRCPLGRSPWRANACVASAVPRCAGITQPEVDAIIGINGVLSQTIASIAAETGAGFIDFNTPAKGTGCGGAPELIHCLLGDVEDVLQSDTLLDVIAPVVESFHPKRAGYQLYGNVALAALG